MRSTHTHTYIHTKSILYREILLLLLNITQKFACLDSNSIEKCRLNKIETGFISFPDYILCRIHFFFQRWMRSFGPWIMHTRNSRLFNLCGENAFPLQACLSLAREKSISVRPTLLPFYTPDPSCHCGCLRCVHRVNKSWFSSTSFYIMKS